MLRYVYKILWELKKGRKWNLPEWFSERIKMVLFEMNVRGEGILIRRDSEWIRCHCA